MNRRAARICKILMAGALIVSAASASAQYRPGRQKPGRVLHESVTQVPLPFDARVDGPATLELEAADAQPSRIDILGWSWGKTLDSTTVYSADPMEGGQIAARKAGGYPHHGRLDAAEGSGLNAGRPADGGASEGGGGLNAGRPADGGASEGSGGLNAGRPADGGASEGGGGLNAGRPADGGASEGGGGLNAGRPADGGASESGGGLNAGRPVVGEPLPTGTLTIRIPRGSAVKGQHLPEVKLSARGRTYELRDVEVAACTSDGDTDVCALTYQTIGD